MMATSSTKPPKLVVGLNHFNHHHHQRFPFSSNYKEISFLIVTRKPSTSSITSSHHHYNTSFRPLLIHASTDGSGSTVDVDDDATSQPPSSSFSFSSEIEGVVEKSLQSSKDGYVPLFVRMLGLDNDPLDREQAIVALWKYSLGGKQCIDMIMKFPGCVNLTVNLLRSDSSSTCEAAAGLLRTISAVNVYRDSVAQSGAVEGITALLHRSSLTAEVKEQSICTLWNLSVDEKLRIQITNSELLPALIKFLDNEEMKIKEAAGGVLANLALSHSNHKIMVEAGVISKLAKVLKDDAEGSKVIRKVAKNALLKLAKDDFYRILVIEEGLILVPLVGADAYKSFRPVSHSWPSFPDGTELQRSSSTPSRYGASELLLGLNIQGKNFDLEEAKMNAIVGRTQQQFLARIGAIEVEEGRKPQLETSTNQQYTLLPWIDGVARLVIILGLEDVSAISRAALSIADASINEHMRTSFAVAGAIKYLVQLLNHHNENVKLAACHALERLSVSNGVCNMIESEGAGYALVNALKCKEMPENLMEKTVNILARILDPGKEMKSKFYDGPVNGSAKSLHATSIVDGKTDDVKESATTREYVLDSGVISRFIEIMKTSPSLQRQAASVLEYIATIEASMDELIAADIESGLNAVFDSRFVRDMEKDTDTQQLELRALEAGIAISAASRLLTKLLDIEQYRHSIKSTRLKQKLRKVLMSNIPLHSKDWVAACLIKLESAVGSQLDPENLINKDITLYETIPRLVEQIRTSFSPEAQEAAVIELNAIISTGVVDFTRAVADKGGIFPLVKMIEKGSRKAVEVSLAILFNLSMDNENHSAMIAAGAVPALRRIVLSQGPQWMLALRLLRTLPTQ
ncbi:Arm repeat superfamily protein [Thalictrum thalictroides]|uniref:Arm repeat superfamily protein n=1 Tax=Thalictrum thalictroides TaxID=46969 RepID=A0A7J6X075_THATH|nr:Arm repeat superfamily protein [Thalictrum thalictroides]